MKNAKILLAALVLVCVLAGGVDASEFTLNNSWDASGTWYVGALHMHTTNSDGVNSPTEVATYYRDQGNQFIAITDHCYVTPDPGVTGIINIGGSEETVYPEPTSDPSAFSHMGSIGATETVYSLKYAQKVIDGINNQGALATLNHPASVYPYSTRALDTMKNYTLVEYEGNTDVYDYVLSNGTKAWLSVGDDEHNVSDGESRGSHVIVNAQALTKADIINGLRLGHFYVSYGPRITNWSVSGHIITVNVTEPSNIRWVGRYNTTLQTTTNVLSDNYIADGSEMYIRAEVVDVTSHKLALTQPVYVTQFPPQPQSSQPPTPISDSLVLCYNFTHDVNNTIVDDSDNHLNGTNYNSVLVNLPSGAIARNFNGSTYISTNHSSVLNLTNYTVEAIVQPSVGAMNTTSTGKQIISKGSLYTPNYVLYYEGSTNSLTAGFNNVSNGFNTVTSMEACQNNNTYHILTTFDGTNLTIYKNGELNFYKYVSLGTPQPNTLPLNIGGSGSRFFKGNISLVSVYSRAFNASEARDQYRSREYAVYAPKALFTCNRTSFTGSGAVQFADQSVSAASWMWDFGDGSTSTEQSPVHTYLTEGEYTVSLVVNNTYENSSTYSQNIIISPYVLNPPTAVKYSFTNTWLSTVGMVGVILLMAVIAIAVAMIRRKDSLSLLSNNMIVSMQGIIIVLVLILIGTVIFSQLS